MRRVRPAAPITVALLAALAAVGCQPPQSAKPPEAVQAAPTGTVSIDLAAIRAAWGTKRKVLQNLCDNECEEEIQPDDPETFQVSQLRLTVKGPGMTQDLVATIPFDDTDNTSGTASTPIASFTLAVPAGFNRYFRLEALNADGRVIHTARSLAGITAGQKLSVRFHSAADAAARTLESLMGPVPANQTDTAGVRAKLATEDFTVPLLTYVIATSSFDADTNLFTYFPPTHFRSEVLATMLRTSGKALLSEDAQSNEHLTANGVSSNVQVEVLESNPQGSVVTVSLCAHDTQHRNGNSVDFSSIPPGTYTVRAYQDGRSVWDSVTISDTPGGQESMTLTLPTPTPTPIPSQPPA